MCTLERHVGVALDDHGHYKTPTKKTMCFLKYMSWFIGKVQEGLAVAVAAVEQQRILGLDRPRRSGLQL